MEPDEQGKSREPVGYAKPPVHSRFQPGQSGNPGGRAKGRTLTSILREVLESNTLGGKPIPQGRTVADMLGDVIIREALKGKFTFAKEVLERTEGKVPDKVDVTSNGRTVGTANLSRLESNELDSLESIVEKLVGGPEGSPPPGEGGEVPS